MEKNVNIQNASGLHGRPAGTKAIPGDAPVPLYITTPPNSYICIIKQTSDKTEV